MTADSRTRPRVASSKRVKLPRGGVACVIDSQCAGANDCVDPSGLQADLADDFTARVSHRTPQEFLQAAGQRLRQHVEQLQHAQHGGELGTLGAVVDFHGEANSLLRSEEHTSELHHLGISYAVFCLKKKKTKQHKLS